MNFRAVLGILGFLLILIGAMMLPATAFSTWDGDGDARALLISSAVTMLSGGALWLGFKNHRHGLGKREGFLIASTGWAAASLFGCLPFLISGSIPSFTNAFFETISGFTTTGSSILSDIEALPRGILFWRATTQWIGGMGILLLSIAILPLLGVGGMQLFNAEVSHVTVEKLTPRISQTARILWLIYLSLTVVLTAVLMIEGLSLFDAAAHAFTTVATGGFSTKNASIAHFPSPLVQYALIVGMFLAGASFTLHFRALRGKSLRGYMQDNEFVYYAVAIVLATAAVYAGIPAAAHAGLEERFRAALFQVVSLISSTGYISSDYALWAPAAQLLLVFLMVHAGCAGSTSGGMKIMRWVLLLKSWKTEIHKLAHPRAIFVVRYNGRAVSPDIISSVQAFLVAYVAIFALCTLLLTALGLDVLSAASAVVTAMGNVGPGLGSVGAVENFGHIATAGKWILSFCMLMGRLELFTVLVLFSPALWKR
jgi:trk system potassium uptake protein